MRSYRNRASKSRMLRRHGYHWIPSIHSPAAECGNPAVTKPPTPAASHPMGLPVRKSKVVPPPACPLTESLALLRGAWAPNVIWYLSGEPRRFGELRHDI